ALRADPGPRAVEHLHRDLEALALLADQVVGGDAAVVEEDLAGRRALDPHLRLDPPDLEAGRPRLDDEGRDAGVARARIARRADLRDLLDRDEAEQRARAEPPVLLLEEDAEELVLAEELDDVPRKLRRPVDLRRAGRDPLARERAHEVADLALLVGEQVGRHSRSLGSRGCRRNADSSSVWVEASCS